MRIHQQFDLDIDNIKPLGREFFAIPPYIMENLITRLSKKGYTVLISSAYYMGIPQSITVIKKITGTTETKFSSKIKEDFDAVSKGLKIEKLFV